MKSSRQIAKDNKEKYYFGRICKRCGTCLKLTSNSNCIECHKNLRKNRNSGEYQKAYTNRQEAINNNLKTYIGRPCKNCGEMIKTTKYSSCVKCNMLLGGFDDSIELLYKAIEYLKKEK